MHGTMYHPSSAPTARHRRSAGAEDPAPLLRRYVGAGAVWMLAFGLVAMAEGWVRTGVLGLAAGAVIALLLLATQLVRGGHAGAQPVRSRVPEGSRSSEWVRTQQT